MNVKYHSVKISLAALHKKNSCKTTLCNSVGFARYSTMFSSGRNPVVAITQELSYFLILV